jgi:hypothetical protein
MTHHLWRESPGSGCHDSDRLQLGRGGLRHTRVDVSAIYPGSHERRGAVCARTDVVAAGGDNRLPYRVQCSEQMPMAGSSTTARAITHPT